jgi:hypothetical protein
MHPFSAQTLFLDPDGSGPQAVRDERPGSTLHCTNTEDHVFVVTADGDLVPVGDGPRQGTGL